MSLDAQWALRWIELAAADVAQQRDYLVDLDRAIGDGDHGENMDRGFTAAVEALREAQPGSVADGRRCRRAPVRDCVPARIEGRWGR